MKKIFGALSLLGLGLVSLAACGEENSTPVEHLEKISIWVSSQNGTAELTRKQVSRFMEKESIQAEVEVSGMSEAQTAETLLTDLSAGADIYCFTQNQLARLLASDAIMKIPNDFTEDVMTRNDEQSVEAATLGETLYAFPLSSFHGYVMYYDKSIITDPSDMTKIIQECEAKDRKISFKVTDSYYSYSYFKAAGCTTSWEADDNGNFISYHDDYNSNEGLVATKGLYELMSSKAWINSDTSADFGAASKSAVVVTNYYGDDIAKQNLGENYGVAELPYFTVDGNKYHLASFNSANLMGIKPQHSKKRAEILSKIANYLTGFDCQKERIYQLQWAPTNKNVKMMDYGSVAENAYKAQSAYATNEKEVLGSWWLAASNISFDIQKSLGNEESLKECLVKYEAALRKLYAPSGYVLMGSWNEWNNADYHYVLVNEAKGIYSWTLKNVKAGDKGQITKANQNDSDKGYNEITSGADLVTNQSGNCFGFIEAGNYKVTYNETEKSISIEKVE